MNDWPDLKVRHAVLNRAETRALFSQYARDHEATIRYYDLHDVDPEPNAVTIADLGRMVFMNARLEGDDAATLLRLGNSPDADWARFPTDVAIADAVADPQNPDPGSLWAAMLDQYSVLRKKGLRDAKITKLLHLKRPLLFPILDSFVNRFYRDAGIPRERWAPIRDDVIANTDSWQQLRSAARMVQDPAVQLLAQLTDLRLHDIAVWSIVNRNEAPK